MTTALNIRIAQRPSSREWHSFVQPKPGMDFGMHRGVNRLVATFAMNRAPNQGHGLEHSANAALAIREPLRM